LALAACCLACSLPASAPARELSADVLLGFNGGTGGQVGFKLADPYPQTPWGVRLSVAYIRSDVGDATQALLIFRDYVPATNPNETGVTWNARLDASYRFDSRTFSELSVFGGVRYASFTGTIEPVSGEEKLEVTSDPWGLGIGVEMNFEFGEKSDFVVVGGLDYYFRTDISDGRTTYSPGGEPINGYTYDEVDKAINQPRWEPLIMAGISFRFGR
jgi:hypothetical protein